VFKRAPLAVARRPVSEAANDEPPATLDATADTDTPQA